MSMDLYRFVHSLASHFSMGCCSAGGGREPKIIRKSMLKRGAQKGGPKGENKWLDVHLEWQAQSKRCLPLSTKTQNIIENVSI